MSGTEMAVTKPEAAISKLLKEMGAKNSNTNTLLSCFINSTITTPTAYDISQHGGNKPEVHYLRAVYYGVLSILYIIYILSILMISNDKLPLITAMVTTPTVN